MAIDIFDKETPLSELRDILGWDTTHENTEHLVMVLCQRFESLERRVVELEKMRANIIDALGDHSPDDDLAQEIWSAVTQKTPLVKLRRGGPFKHPKP